MKSKILVYTALGLICLIAPSILFYLFGHFHFPPSGGDLGDWLRYAYALFENRYPLWDNNPWQYPPLTLIIIYLLAKLTSEVMAVRLIGYFLMGLLPIPMFLLAKKIAGKDSIALIVALLIAMSRIYYDMYSWGGLPNLFGFFLLPLTFLYIIKFSENPTRANLFRASVFSTIVVLTHHLTTIILLMTLGILSLYSLIKRRSVRKWIAITLGPTSAFLSYRFFCGSNEFVMFNESAWHRLYVDFPVLVWVFRDVAILGIYIILTVPGFIWMHRDNKPVAVLFGWWAISPFLFCSLWIPKLVAIDFRRFLIFAVQPVIILTLFVIHKAIASGKEITARTLSVAVIVLLLLLTFYTGPVAFTEDTIRYYPKSDDQVYEPVMWIKENTEPSDTIVTRDGPIGRWIEGVAHRRVLIYGDPAFQFIRGQHNMCVATEALLTSNILYQNDMFKIKDQAPTLLEKTPFIYVYHEGDYKLLGFLCDYFFQINWENGTDLTGYGTYEGYNVSKDDFSYSVYFMTPHFEVNRTINLSMDDRIDLEYVVKSRGNVKITSISFPLWLYKYRQPIYSNGLLSTNIGDITLTTNAVYASSMFDPEHDKYKIVMEFEPQGDETVIYLSLATSNKRLTRNNRISFTTFGIIEQFKVAYALISKTDQEAQRWLTIQPEVWSLVYDGKVYQIYRL